MTFKWYDYQVEYATPKQIPGDGIKWVVHSTVSAGRQGVALIAAREDARRLRAWHHKVRITRNGRAVK